MLTLADHLDRIDRAMADALAEEAPAWYLDMMEARHAEPATEAPTAAKPDAWAGQLPDRGGYQPTKG